MRRQSQARVESITASVPGVETSVNELYRLIAQAMGVSLEATHAPAKPGEQLRSSVDSALAKKVLGWAPNVRIQDGIERTAAFFKRASGP